MSTTILATSLLSCFCQPKYPCPAWIQFLGDSSNPGLLAC